MDQHKHMCFCGIVIIHQFWCGKWRFARGAHKQCARIFTVHLIQCPPATTHQPLCLLRWELVNTEGWQTQYMDGFQMSGFWETNPRVKNTVANTSPVSEN